ncbi:50S ribosome-binding GTPase [Patescibacteria group bacterium]|nr:50S ribosome-binding GTPase [Patescibacteria group bacterium]MBU1868221.1 50S ribosome-binding GTPase [Patescibacteria group bacterium]
MKKFIDLCRITVAGGRGGDGLVSFRRERGKPKAGLDGGDGGDGGNLYLETDYNLGTLYDFTNRTSFKAGHGARGGPNDKKGARGKDFVLRVPPGTLVRENVNQLSDQKAIKAAPTLAELSGRDDKVLIACGGRGGRGNAHLPRSSDAMVEYKEKPRRFCQFKGRSKGDSKYYWAEKGMAGQRKEILLELKLIADIGIVGLPNAGKSTLLNALTSSRAEVGSYPFTTLHPNLGVLKLDGTKRGRQRSLVVADIPGLVEGASEGKGLGDEFLRHVERTRVLIHLIDPLTVGDMGESGSDLTEQSWRNYRVVRRELIAWSKALLEKPELIVINKGDVTEVQVGFSEIRERFRLEMGSDVPVILISAVTGQGFDNLLVELRDLVGRIIQKSREDESTKRAGAKDIKIYHINNLKHYKI